MWLSQACSAGSSAWPISRFTLASADYLQVGRDLASAGLPTVFTLEGGYAVAAMGVNVVNVLEGFNAA